MTLLFLWYFSCITPPPANRPPRGPDRGPFAYHSTYNSYEPYRSAGFLKITDQIEGTFLTGLGSGILFSSYTMPLFATAAEGGNTIVKYSQSCLFGFFCSTDYPETRRLQSIQSVDVHVLKIPVFYFIKVTVIERGT